MGKTNGISRRQWIAARLCTGTLVALPRGPGQALRYRKLKEKRWLTLANFPPYLFLKAPASRPWSSTNPALGESCA